MKKMGNLSYCCMMGVMTTMSMLSQCAVASTARLNYGTAFNFITGEPHTDRPTRFASNSLSSIFDGRNKSHGNSLRKVIPIPTPRKNFSITSSLHRRSNQALHASLLPLEGLSPLYLSGIAGASTCIGAAIVFLVPQDEKGKRPISSEMMCYSLALAGSVMVTVSLISIIPESLLDASGTNLISVQSAEFGQRCLSLGLGCLVYFTLSWFAFPEPDELLKFQPTTVRDDSADPISISSHSISQDGAVTPSSLSSTGEAIATFPTAPIVTVSSKNNNHDTFKLPFAISSSHWTAGGDLETVDQQRAWRVAMLLFISLLFHNFPEGLAVAASAMESDKLGLAVTIGIMVHNIPEGISIAVPCLAARPNQPWLAFVLASLSGLAEPVGALMTLRLLDNGNAAAVDNTNTMGNVLAFVAGIMVTVALRELFPEAKRQISSDKDTAVFEFGLVSGFLIMSLTEWYLA